MADQWVHLQSYINFYAGFVKRMNDYIMVYVD